MKKKKILIISVCGSGYRMFLQAMEQVLENEPQAIDLRRGQTNSHYTFLVPNDEAFRNAGATTQRRLQTDQAYMTKVKGIDPDFK